MIKGTVQYGGGTWVLRLKGKEFTTRNKFISAVMKPMASIMDAVAEIVEHHPDQEQALWEFAAEWVSPMAVLTVTEPNDPGHRSGRKY